MNKIIYVIPALYGGGAEKQLYILTKALAENVNYTISVLYMHKPSQELFQPVNNINYVYLGDGGYLQKFYKFYKFIREHRPDIVQSTVVPADIFAGIATFFFKFKWILRETNDMSLRKQSSKLKLRKFLATRAEKIVCNSSTSANYWGSFSSKVQIIRNGVSVIKPELMLNKGASNQITLLYIGRLEAHKNILRLVESFLKVNSEIAQMIIIGKGSLEEEIKSMSHYSDRITFKSYTSSEEINKYYTSADIFCNLSDYEGMPNTVLEAASACNLLLLSNINAHIELFDESAAIYVKQDNNKAVIEAINNAIDMVKETQHERMIDKSYNIALKFDKKKMIDNYKELYKSV